MNRSCQWSPTNLFGMFSLEYIWQVSHPNCTVLKKRPRMSVKSPWRPIKRPALISAFCSMKRQGLYRHPPDSLVPRPGLELSPSRYFLSITIYWLISIIYRLIDCNWIFKKKKTCTVSVSSFSRILLYTLCKCCNLIGGSTHILSNQPLQNSGQRTSTKCQRFLVLIKFEETFWCK